MSQNQYYIFGLQRSGTNFLENILRTNYKATKLNRTTKSWKHSIDVPEGYNSKKPTVLIHKNPYTWVESICLRNKVDWLKTQKTYPADEIEDEHLSLGRMNIKNLAKTYKHFHDTWLSQDIHIIQYEMLLEKSEKLLGDLETSFGWNRTSSTLSIPPRGKVSQSKDYDETREKYYKSQTPKKLTKYHIKTINDILGDDTFKKLGYKKIS